MAWHGRFGFKNNTLYDSPPRESIIMTLLELCEPIFQYTCRVNRIARNGGQLEYVTARAEVKERLESIAAKASADSRLNTQYKKTELPLLFFIDSMIVESGINCSSEWDKNRLAYEHDELAGDEAFFDFLDESAKDTSDEGAERLAFFYVCLGLGFCGFYIGQTEILKQKMIEILPRIRRWVDTDHHSRISPDAYEHLNTANLVEPPTFKLFGIAIVFITMCVLVFASVIFLFYSSSSDLSNAMERINKYGAVAVEEN